MSDLFTGVVAKRLTLVETITEKSNQHEFQGAKPLRALLGEEDRKGIPTRFVLLGEEQAAFAEDGFVSWSNVRKGKPRAPEFHLYYSDNAVTQAMKEGDTFFLAIRSDGSAMVIIAPSETTMQSQLLWLFGMPEQTTFGFEFRDIEHDDNAQLDFAARYILDELGIDIEEPESDRLDGLIDRFGLTFPTGRALAELARTSLPHINAMDNPDSVLMAWVVQEEMLFRRLERRVVADRLRSGFMGAEEADVEGFLSFSLSVQNRRKSRAGQSLENHLEALFTARSILFGRGVETENRNRPDFVFPGAAEYRDPSFPSHMLTMLGAKSTLKDRWRQVLSEAARIDQKHLLTLEPGVSENQTNEMRAKSLQLVIPRELHATYRVTQQGWLMDVTGFLELVSSRQR